MKAISPRRSEAHEVKRGQVKVGDRVCKFPGRFFIALTLLANVTIFAHDFHVGICDISYNERSGNTEIVHSYPMHGVEAALWFMYGRQMDLSKPADEALLRGYIEKNFSINPTGKSALPIKWVGMSQDADTLTIYQELPKFRLPKRAEIRNSVLMEYFPTQVNNVNVRRGAKTETLVFDRKTSQRVLAE